MRQTIKIGLMIVAVVAVATTGIALAQTDEQTERYQSGVLERLAPLVEEGTISQDQADAIAEDFTEEFTERFAQREERRAAAEANRQELLDLLGVTPEEFRESLAGGATLAEMAEQQGTTGEAVIDLLVSHAEERVAEAVENGRLTQEEADEKLVDITANITDKVNNGGGFGKGFGPGHWHGPKGEGFGGRGFGGPGFDASDTPATDAAVNA